jgi:hypothetical protein
MSPQAFEYVGPEETRIRSLAMPSGRRILACAEIVEWLSSEGAGEDGWATYVVDVEGTLVLAPRRSEHVACAGGEAVLAAGEICFAPSGEVVAVTNNSTGYCPPETCWSAVCHALDRARVPRPDAWTFVAMFRRCPRCGERNLVKDEWFVCALCDAELPREWNFAP